MLLVVALSLLAQDAVEPPKSKPMRIGTADLEVTDVTPAVKEVVQEALLVELRKLARTSVIGWSEIRQMLDVEATKQSLGCGVDGACLAEIADAAGVDVFVAGSLHRTATESVLTLTRIDQHEGKVIGKVQKRLQPQDGEEWLAALGPAIAELFPDVALKSGAVRGVDKKLALRLNPPPLPAWTPYAAGAASVGLLAGAVGAGIFWQVQQSDYKALAATPGIEGKSVVDKGNLTVTSEAAMWALGGMFVVGAGATAASIPFTDFGGDT